MIKIILLFLGTYFYAAIPFALVVSKVRKVDLRKIGSGNIGATNVYRAMGLKWAILVFLLDGLKGFLPTYYAIYTYPNSPLLHILVGITTILAHAMTIFAKFKGGKGAATGLGVLLALSPKIFIISAIAATIIIGLTRYVSVGTICCCVALPFLFYFGAYPKSYTLFVTIICIFIIYRHKKNIERLFQGKENKIF